MEGEEKEQLCINCKRFVSSTNFTTHSAYCEKNIFVCKICNEPVKKTERNEHLEEYHVILQCDLCEAAIEKWMLPEHMEICPRRLIKCEYCEAEFPLNEYTEHVDFCGSRTEKCLLCKKYIMNKDKAKHTELHRFEEKYRRKKMCEIEQNEVNEMISGLEKNIDEKPSKAKLDNSGFEKEKLKRLDTDRRVGANFEGINELVPDVVSCNIRQTEQDVNIQSLEGAAASPNKTKEKSNRYGECHICKQLIPWIDMNTHIPGCASLAGKCSVCGEEVPSHAIKNHMKEHFSGYSKKMPVKEPQNPNSYSKKKSFDNNQSCVAKVPSEKKCPHCSHPCLDDEILEHVKTCPKNMFECPLCFEKVSVKDKLKHETSDCRIIWDNSEMNRTYSSRSACQSFYECPLCSENVPEESRHRHVTFDCKSLLKSSGPQGLFSMRGDFSNVYQCPLCLEDILEKDKKRHELFECKVLIENAGVHIPEPESYSEVTKGTCRCKCRKNSSDVCKCRNRISENRMAEHEKSCERRKVPCQFCNQVIDVSCEHIHSKYCPGMNSNKNFSEHRSNTENSRKSNHEFKGAIPKNTSISEMMRPQTAKCKYCQTSLNLDILKYHEDECVQRPVNCPDCSKEIQVKDLGVHKCKKKGKKDKKNKINQESPEGKNEPGIGTKIWNYICKPDCNKEKDESGNVNRQYQYSGYSNYSSYGHRQVTEQSQPLYFSETDNTLIPCEFCSEKFPASELVLHETGCQPDLVSYAKEDSSKDSNISESSTRQDSVSSLTKSMKDLVPAERVKTANLTHVKHSFFAGNRSFSSSSTYEHKKYRGKSDTEPGEFLQCYEKSPPEHDKNSRMKENESKEKKESFGIQSVWNATSIMDKKTKDDDSKEISKYSEVAMYVDQYEEPYNKYERYARCAKGNVEPASEEIDSDVTAMLSFLEGSKNNKSDKERNEYTTNDNSFKSESSENEGHNVLDSDLLIEDIQERHEKDFSNPKKVGLTGKSTTILRENLRFAANSTKDKKEDVSKISHIEDSILDSYKTIAIADSVLDSYKTVAMPCEQIADEAVLCKKNNDGPNKLDKQNNSVHEKEYIIDFKKHLSDFKYASHEKTPFSDENSKVCAVLYEKDDKEYEKLYVQNNKASTCIDNTKDKKECVNSFKYLADLKFGSHNSTALSCEDSTYETVIQKKEDEEPEKLSTRNISRHTVSTKVDEECISDYKKYFPDFKFASNEKRSISVEDDKYAVLSKKNDEKREILSKECHDKTSKHIDSIKDKTVWASNFNQLGDFKFGTCDLTALSNQNNVHETVPYEKKDDEPEKLCKQDFSQHIDRTKDESECISDFTKHFPDFKFATHEKPPHVRSEKNDKKHEKLSEQPLDKSSRLIDYSKVKTECAGNFSQLTDIKFSTNESTALFSKNKMHQTVQREKRDEPEKFNQQKISYHIDSTENEKENENDFSKYLPDFKFSAHKTKSSSSKNNTYHASLTEEKDGHFEKSAFKGEPAESSLNEAKLDMDHVRKGLEDLEAKIAKFHLQTLRKTVENEDPTKWSKWRKTEEKSSDSSDSE